MLKGVQSIRSNFQMDKFHPCGDVSFHCISVLLKKSVFHFAAAAEPVNIRHAVILSSTNPNWLIVHIKRDSLFRNLDTTSLTLPL